MEQSNPKLERALELMHQKGLNGLVVFSGGTCSILAPSYLHYFCECRPMGPGNAAVLAKDGRVVLLIQPLWDTARVSSTSWIKDVRGTSDFIADLVAIMRECSLSGPVGIAGLREMAEEAYAAAGSVANLEPADGIIEEMARKKTPREIQIVYDAARIADAGFEAFFKHATPGTREYELAAEMEFAMRAAGADDIFILLSSGPHNEEMHEPTDRRLEPGDIIIGEITPVCEGQFMQWCRTIVIGKPGSILADKYDLLLRALDESLKEVRSGAEASAMVKAMNRVISDAGYGKYCYPPYMRARGHGFGVGSIAPGGTIDEETRIPLEQNQVLVVHPNQYLPETGYLACGETFLVTDSGAERLSRTETKLHAKEV